jgi:hypothetical protein
MPLLMGVDDGTQRAVANQQTPRIDAGATQALERHQPVEGPLLLDQLSDEEKHDRAVYFNMARSPRRYDLAPF